MAQTNAVSVDEGSSWRTMPHKDQLLVLCLSRLSEPITRTSFSTYIYYQLQSLDPSLSSAEIVRQATWMQTALTAMVALVSLPTSRLADSPRFGRKGVLLASMAVLGTSTLCFGFIRSFTQAMVLRIIEGTFSGGTLVARTMIPEIVPGKKHRVKAFLLLPLAFNIGVLAGPPITGLLVAYAQSHAGKNDFLGRWTYAPPMLMAGGIIYTAFLAVFFLLEETLPALRGQPDIGIRIKKAVVRLWQRYRSRGATKLGYEPANTQDSEDSQDLDPLLSPEADDEAQRGRSEPIPTPTSSKMPLRKALTANVLLATSCQAMLDGLTAGYNTLWPLFLSDPPASAALSLRDERGSSPLRFSGGAGLQPYQIALTLTILAVTALPLQILVYPRVSYKLKPLGTLRCFLWCPALAFALAPFIAVTAKFPVLMWLVIAVVQLLMVLTAAMVVPSATLMTNNSAPSPAALAATHGLAVTLSAVARTIGPFAVGSVYAASQASHNGGLAWWLMAGTAICICVISWFVQDGTEQGTTAPPAREETGEHGARSKPAVRAMG
ncbi:major facilitator superfamily transporter [Colletotrichum higginsianum]|uniref:Major facilitator superfamily transporter n=2 Tax=Colletotrichum higginsianum TaxID=80884 RepID=H1VWH8_COLHI|nr:Major facilitator superfamily transporter [Colletotrichum higginsianum IMI 349063]OBR09596.1 Major facilitator superfamily transporter [Colletotrichum higginsianum IMI 349063]TIC95997.1 putative membrane protein [Colletotrichum higginsianum]CCF44590.1 major facilitator superfamily transporter [Colletotrichum higginsianum]